MTVCCARSSCFKEVRTLFLGSEDGIGSFDTALKCKRSDSLGARSNHFYSAFVQINVGGPEPAASFC